MASITVTSNVTTTDNNLIITFTTDIANITNIELTKDGTNYISALLFDNKSAVFDVSSWSNASYSNCKLRVTYNNDDSGGGSIDDEKVDVTNIIYISEYDNPTNDDYTAIFQSAITEAATKKKKIKFGRGVYKITGTISVPDNCVIEIEGNTDAFANSMHRYSKDLNGTTLWYENINNETLILFTDVGTLFKVPGGSGKGTIFKFSNLSFRNAASQTGDYILKGRVVGQTTVDSASKGKIYAENCIFAGFKVCFGDKYVTSDLENMLSALDGRTKMSKPTTKMEKCCFVGSRCRFVACGAATNLGVDSRYIDCSFNTGWYGVVFQENSGISTISNCRLEWLKINGVYSTDSHDVTIIGNEFDRIGWAGVYFMNDKKPNISSNIFRRCGSDTNYDYAAKTKNVHIYVDGCAGGAISSNVTIKKEITDSGGKYRPSNSMCIRNNDSIVVVGNDFTGCTTGTNNTIANNTNSIVEHNNTYIPSGASDDTTGPGGDE